MTRAELRACGPFWMDFSHEKNMYGVECSNPPNGGHYILFVPNDEDGSISTEIANILNSALNFPRGTGR
jgi:hypothetical protein